MDRGALREGHARGVLVGLVAHDRDALDAFGMELGRDLGHRDLTVHLGALDGLSAGHRDRAVGEDLVRDVHAGRDGGADRQQAGMEVGPVAQVLEHVGRAGEGRGTDPVAALAAHLCDRERGSIGQPHRHAVTPDAAEREAVLRDHGRRVVGAAGAEGGQPHQPAAGNGRGRRLRGTAQVRHVGRGAGDPAPQDVAEDRGRELTLGRHQGLPLRVALARDARAVVLVVERARDLLFEQRSLLFDHEHVVEVAAELAQAFGLDGPDEGDLVDLEADLAGTRLVDAELVESLADVEGGFARRDDADPSARGRARMERARPEHDAVEAIRPCERERRRQPLLVEPGLDLERNVGEADVEAFGSFVRFRQHDRCAVRADLDRAAALHGVGQALEAHPAAGVAGEGVAVEAKIDVVLDARRVQCRDPAMDERVFALVRDRRGLGSRVVARQREDTAVGGRTRVVRMLEGIAGAVDAGPLAVPQAEDAVVAWLRVEVRLLRSPDGGGGQVFVHARLEVDLMTNQVILGLPQGHVECAEGRPAVARDEPRRIEPGRRVARVLEHGQAHERLDAGQVDASRLAGVAILERVLGVEGRGRVRRTHVGDRSRVGSEPGGTCSNDATTAYPGPGASPGGQGGLTSARCRAADASGATTGSATRRRASRTPRGSDPSRAA